MANKQPRGIRNNNPGNIRYNGIEWKGLATPPSDGAFCIFTSAKWGIRALAVLLRNYNRNHGIRSVSGIINRFAPSVENNTEAYIAQVCKALGCKPTEQIEIASDAILLPLVKAIIRHENGKQPYSDKEIMEAFEC